MTLKQALISGCAIALLSVDPHAQPAPAPPVTPPPAPPASPAPANTRRITGKVLDALTNDGQPFTRVIIKRTTTGTEQETDGSFSLDVPQVPVTLLFSSQDHKDREETVGATRDSV